MSGTRRRRVEHTDDWQELLPLFDWPEQEAYEELRPLVLFGDAVAERPQKPELPSGRCTAGWSASRGTA